MRRLRGAHCQRDEHFTVTSSALARYTVRRNHIAKGNRWSPLHRTRPRVSVVVWSFIKQERASSRGGAEIRGGRIRTIDSDETARYAVTAIVFRIFLLVDGTMVS